MNAKLLLLLPVLAGLVLLLLLGTGCEGEHACHDTGAMTWNAGAGVREAGVVLGMDYTGSPVVGGDTDPGREGKTTCTVGSTGEEGVNFWVTYDPDEGVVRVEAAEGQSFGQDEETSFEMELGASTQFTLNGEDGPVMDLQITVNSDGTELSVLELLDGIDS
jgi:hypothetical protein